MSFAIQVQNISKLYSKGHGSKTSQKALSFRPAGSFVSPKKKSEYLNFFPGPSEDTFWALKDVSFDVSQGEVVGIVGRNGSGKSTLMKLLSKLTEPTTGKIILRGKTASILEVGTGFRPDLTGKENIFLNGAILGMSYREIQRKFDAIVEFSGVEQFIDTAVKHYSSGMYMRLAFSVASQLEPEILIMDEVLAVGDLEFQKKCLRRISEIARAGKTVLFVSHSFAHIVNICTRGIEISNGRIIYDGKPDQLIEKCVKSIERESAPADFRLQHFNQSDFFSIEQILLKNSNGNESLEVNFKEEFEIEIKIKVILRVEKIRVGAGFSNLMDTWIGRTHYPEKENEVLDLPPGEYRFRFSFSNPLWPGSYYVGVGAHQVTENGLKTLDYIPQALLFSVNSVSHNRNIQKPLSYNQGLVTLDSKSGYEKIS